MTSLAAALLSFLWQGAILGVVAWVGFSLSRSPRVRYLIGVVVLALMAAAPIVTAAASLRGASAQPSAVDVQGSPKIEVEAKRSGGEALRAGTQSFGESGTSTTRLSWVTERLADPRVASIVIAIWLIGVGLLSSRLAFGWIGARRLTRHVEAAGANLQAVADHLIEKLRIRATVEIVESALVTVPSVIGAFKPVVLLPAAAMSGLSMEQVEALLAHELAHVRRHDYLVNLFQSAIETLLFYHPAVWLVSRRVRQERELCCDDLALEVCSDRVAYASALADLESLRALPSPALAATGGSLLTRIRRILANEESSPLAGRSQSVAGVAILAAIILLAGGQVARARAVPPSVSAGEIVEPDGTGGRRAPDAPQVQGPVAGVQGGISSGVVGGVQGGVKGGVKGGMPESVPILVSAADDPTLKIPEDTDITVRVKSNGKAVKQFTDAPLHVGKDGFATLPLLGRYQIAGKTLREAATSIRGDLIFRKFFADPDVDVRANMEIFPAMPVPVETPRGVDTVKPVEVAQAPPQAAPVETKRQDVVPDAYIVRLGDELNVWVMSPIQQPEFSARTYKVQTDGSIKLPHLDQPLKIVGFTILQTREAVRTALISAFQYTNPVVDVNLVGYKNSDLIEVSAEPMDASTPPISAGQVVRLEVVVGQVRQAEFNKDYTVQADGNILVPYIGATRAAGLTTKDLGSLLASALNTSRTLPGARVTASIETRTAPPAPRNISVTVQGAVRAPGNQMLREDRNTIADAISSAGGFQPSAGARVFLRRNGTPDRTFSKTALLQGQVTDKIQDGDTITVETAPHFYVTGFVKSSSDQYSWEPGLTLGKAIAMAGGPTPDGALNRVRIDRKDPKTGKFAPIKLEKDVMTTPIQPEDVINVPKRRY